MKKINWKLILGCGIGIAIVIPACIIAHNSFKSVEQNKQNNKKEILNLQRYNGWYHVRVLEIVSILDENYVIEIYFVGWDITSNGYYQQWKDECHNAGLL